MMFEEQIRGLLREGLAPEVRPLSPEELSSRAQARSGETHEGQERTHRGFLIAACVVCVTLLGGGLAVLRAPNGGTRGVVRQSAAVVTAPVLDSAAGVKVGRYFLPAGLPEGFELLGVAEHAGYPNPAATGRALYVDEATGGAVSLRAAPEGRWSSSENTTDIDGGIARWSRTTTPGSKSVLFFQIARGNVAIDGWATGIADDGDLTLFFEAINLAPGGDVPTIDDTAYTLRSSDVPQGQQLLALWTAYFGPPGGYFGMAGITISVERYEQPVNTELEAGIWDATSMMNGRTIQLGILDSTPWWTPAPDTIVRVQTAGDTGAFTATHVLASLQEVDDAAFQTENEQITVTANTLAVTEALTFPRGATLDLYGPKGDARGLCLTIEGHRRCELALMLSNGYTSDEQLVSTRIEVLVDQHWYTIGLAQDTDSIDPTAETTPGISGTWYLIAHGDNQSTLTSTDGGLIATRPAR